MNWRLLFSLWPQNIQTCSDTHRDAKASCFRPATTPHVFTWAATHMREENASKGPTEKNFLVLCKINKISKVSSDKLWQPQTFPLQERRGRAAQFIISEATSKTQSSTENSNSFLCRIYSLIWIILFSFVPVSTLCLQANYSCIVLRSTSKEQKDFFFVIVAASVSWLLSHSPPLSVTNAVVSQARL